MNTRQAEIIYQQWQQNNNDYQVRWLDFVEIIVREFNMDEYTVITELQKQRWFEWQSL
jgi:hypothetical protein